MILNCRRKWISSLFVNVIVFVLFGAVASRRFHRRECSGAGRLSAAERGDAAALAG